MRTQLYLTTALRVQDLSAASWAGSHLVPLVEFFSPCLWNALPAGALGAWASRIGRACPPGWYAATPCFTADFPFPPTRLPDADFARLLGNVADLAAALSAHGGAGLVMDCEDYPATPQLSGGRMAPGAWNGFGKAEARGKAFAQRLQGLTFGAFVWAAELHNQPGLASFLRGAWSVTGKAKGLFLGETYLHPPGDAAYAYHLGAGSVKLGTEAPDRSKDWVWDPKGLLLPERSAP